MIEASLLLATVPTSLRDPLFDHYREIASSYLERRWEPAELNGGKFCEVVYSIIEGYLNGKYPPTPYKPNQFADSCKKLEGIQAVPNRVGDKSLRVLVPQILVPLYHIRNNRGVGHVSGEINPNYLDATAVYSMASWILAELVRIFHATTTEIAQESVDMLVERKLPMIWKIGNAKRVLLKDVSKADQTLMLLYSEPGWVSTKLLSEWTKYSNLSMFRSSILKKLDSELLIEFEPKADRSHISPLGSKKVELDFLRTTN